MTGPSGPSGERYENDDVVGHHHEDDNLATLNVALPPSSEVQANVYYTEETVHQGETDISPGTQEDTDHAVLPSDHGDSGENILPVMGNSPASTVSNAGLEVDQVEDGIDLDSAISLAMSRGSTDSVQSSIYDFVLEYGRTYHKYKEGKYHIPNDSTEQDRLDLQHHLMLILLDHKLYLAPIKPNLQKVLDVGTGTGIWAVEFAIQHPSASVIGTDLSPIQPAFVPPNCRFEIDDAEDEWLFSTKFDFIHMRLLASCFSDHRSIVVKAFNALAPGGYLEVLDAAFPLRSHDGSLLDTALDTWSKSCIEGAARLGRNLTNTPNYKQWMEKLGFEDVYEKVFEVPTNTWPTGRKAKELGIWFGADLTDAVGAAIALMTRGLGWDPERVERLLVDVRKNIKDRAIHAYLPIHVIYGRKPKPCQQAESDTAI